MSAARAAARNKPVLVVKSGRSAQGQKAAASHTGALAASDLVFDAAIRRAGMLRVDTLQDLFVAAEELTHFRGRLNTISTDAPDRLTLLTNGGGAGVMAADAAALAGVPLAELSPATLQALDALLPANWSHGNPVDIIGDAPVERYVQTMRALLADPGSGTVLFMHAPTAIVPSHRIAAALVSVIHTAPQRILSCWLGDPGVSVARRTFHDAGIATYDTPEEAVRAFAMIMTYRCNQELLLEAPPARPANNAGIVDLVTVRRIVEEALASGREWMSEPEAKALLAACGVPVAGTRIATASAEDAAAIADALGFPVVLKILSPQISHKSDVGGVVLDLPDAAAVRDAAAAMLHRVELARPDASISGFAVQSMVQRPLAIEVIVGASIDPLFGPVILFGQGGTAVEVVADRAVALPPLNSPLAHALIARTRVAHLLAGWRNVPAADMEALVTVLTTVSQLLADVSQITELDINPLLVDAAGVIALDARVRVRADAPGGAANFAIRPYPSELVETLIWQGRKLTLRPIRPEDEAQHRSFLERLDPIDIRMRVFYSRRSMERSELARLTQIDYEREMAFIATAAIPGDREETLGVVRAATDPDNVDAEFSVIVRSDLKGGGLGELLMHKLIDYQRGCGTKRLVATVLRENRRMLELADELGFAFDEVQPTEDTWAIHLELDRASVFGRLRRSA